ncbi:MAG: histidine phosphatase family protein [Thiohalospira sp.]
MAIANRITTLLGAVALTGLALIPARVLATEALWERLAEGGLVVMVRHTDAESGDQERSLRLTEPRDCSREANLTEQGRAEASSLKAALEAHDVPVARVLTGRFCRTVQTAEEAFGSAEEWAALDLLNAMPAGESDFLMEDVRDRMIDFDGDGNLFLVTHRPNINTLTFHNPEPGDVVLLEVDDFGSTDVIGVISRDAYHD